MGKVTETNKWQLEIEVATKFRDEELGTFNKDKITGAGENIEYYERGWTPGYFLNLNDEDMVMTLNLFHSISKNVIPALLFQNPEIIALPKRRQDANSAFYAKHILNHFYRDQDVNQENQKAVWDAYTIGKGYTISGYATKFGVNIEDESKNREKVKPRSDTILEALGLKKPSKKEDIIFPESDLEIIAESPFVKQVSPFNILIDPRATSINTAQWWGIEMDKPLDEIKRNKKFKNTSQLKGSEPDLPHSIKNKVSETEIEAFKFIRLYEIHYRRPEGFYLLYLAKDQNDYKELYHEKSIYDLNDWQLDEIDFSGHEHKYYKNSEMTKIKALQDRFTSTVDAILEQVDRYKPKVLADRGKFDEMAQRTLEEGDTGAIAWVDGDVDKAVREVNFTQLKADLKALLEEMITIVTIQTGLTKAQLLGIATGETATSSQIAQGGQNLRMSAMGQEIERFSKSQATKYWKIIKQFVPIEELEIITGESGVDPQSGQPLFNWLQVPVEEIDNLRKSDLSFEVRMGSTQKLDTAVIKKSIENLISILARTDVIALMQQQGKKVDLAEILRLYLQQSPEIFRDVNKIIQDITQQTPGQLTPEQMFAQLAGGSRGGTTSGSQMNQIKAQRAESPPSTNLALKEASQI